MLLELLAKIDPGRGNLSANAYLAARVGPYRVAHGSRKNVPLLVADQAVKIASSPGTSDQAIYVGIGLPPGAAPTIVLFSSSEDTSSSSIPGAMAVAFSVGSGISFSAVLLPGDDLYAWSSVANVRLVVSQVGF